MATPLHPAPLILAPTIWEFRSIRKALSNLVERDLVRIARCGEGPVRSASFCEGLDPAAISSLVLVGWAGGLQEMIRVGDVICADAVLMEGRPAIPCQPLSGQGWIAGPILTVARALLSRDEKLTAARTGATAVEMEAYPLAEWALTNHKPFCQCRIILDSRDESLPGLVRDPARGFILRQAQNIAGTLNLIRRIRDIDPRLGALAVETANQLNALAGS